MQLCSGDANTLPRGLSFSPVSQSDKTTKYDSKITEESDTPTKGRTLSFSPLRVGVDGKSTLASGGGGASGAPGDNSLLKSFSFVTSDADTFAGRSSSTVPRTGEVVIQRYTSDPASSSSDDQGSLLQLAPGHIVLSSQHGSLVVDSHQIHFTLSIFGTKDGKSKGCRMDVNFGTTASE